MFQKGVNPGGGYPKGRLHNKTLDRIRIAIRLELRNLGLPNATIAQMIGMNLGAYAMLKRTKIYQTMKQEAITGVVAYLDQDIEQQYEINHKRLTSALPMAIENLFSLAAQNDDKKLKLEASKEIMDREGSFAKVSRIGLPTKDQAGIADTKDGEIAGELINVLAQVKNSERMATEAGDTRNKEVSVTIDSKPISDAPQ